jgi:uncharacterized protein
MEIDLLREYNPWWHGPHSVIPDKFLILRDLYHSIAPVALNLEDRRAVSIAGPRQVGKTTLIKQLLQTAIDDGHPSDRVVYLTHDDFGPHFDSLRRLLDLVFSQTNLSSDSGPKAIIAIDEIQRFENWDTDLKSFIDREKAKFIITGSAALPLTRQASDSLLGRLDEYHLLGLNFKEFLAIRQAGAVRAIEPASIAVEKYFRIGGFPEHSANIDEGIAARRIRRDVIEKALGQDLLGAAEIRKGDSLTRFFTFLVRNAGSILNKEKLANEAGINRKQVDRWLQLLRDADLIYSVNNFAIDGQPKPRGKPKIYPSDPGISAAFSFGATPPPYGQLAECAVLRHLINQLSLMMPGVPEEIGYWRKGESREVDFVGTFSGQQCVFEVTTSRKSSVLKKKLETLEFFRKKELASKAFLISSKGGIDFKADVQGIFTLSFQEFFQLCCTGNLTEVGQ